MATIKAIEGRSIHQIQSGQVIVDLGSVVKELVENSLDAGATSIEVRFKNQGLDTIEVQDNGSGVAPEDFAYIARKHYTSKLSSYDDLSSLQTFGFRGEALSSLCALSKFHIVTARVTDGPKGTKLEFESSGELKGTSVVAATKGTTVTVQNIFYNLPVRKRELEKNIKREYGKVLSLLHAYACISTGVRFVASNQMPKGKKAVVFSTNSNTTTRENIANVYGAKTLLALIPLDLKLEMLPTVSTNHPARKRSVQENADSKQVEILGHISRPVVGEGRQTPDRQMFFVNSRPCALPQIAKAFNEVYKSYNVTQSPFIFANLKMDTDSYDVNVSPDKRTILLHEQTALLESLKSSLLELFESHDQSVPQGQLLSSKVSLFRPLNTAQESLKISGGDSQTRDADVVNDGIKTGDSSELLTRDKIASPDISKEGRADVDESSVHDSEKLTDKDVALATMPPEIPQGMAKSVGSSDAEKGSTAMSLFVQDDGSEEDEKSEPTQGAPKIAQPGGDFNNRILSQPEKQLRKDQSAYSPPAASLDEIPSIMQSSQKTSAGVVQNAFDRMRPKRTPTETATITIGSRTTISTVGSMPNKRRRIHIPKFGLEDPILESSSLRERGLHAFSASGAQPDSSDKLEVTDDEIEDPNSSSAEESSGESSARRANTDPEELGDNDSGDEGSTSRISEAGAESSADDDSDKEFIDEAEKKAQEEEKVAKMIAQAEEAAARPIEDNLKRAVKVLKGPAKKYSTLQWETTVDTTSLDFRMVQSRTGDLHRNEDHRNKPETDSAFDSSADASEEERLSLTVTKSDFGRMRIIGQFNLGFILAVRPDAERGPADQLFIIDQHASDEKYNFERLQKSTILTPQRLVHPHPLELTAIEEETIMHHRDSLTANGFFVDMDTSGDLPVGGRCSLLTLPTSREVTFTPSDLEELLVLLAEHVGGGIPRPTKVRKLLAMRACRGSVMIGKTLTSATMEKIVRHLGEMDKPWNCPHGRPTMRHLYGLESWKAWKEADGMLGLGEKKAGSDWVSFLRARKTRS